MFSIMDGIMSIEEIYHAQNPWWEQKTWERGIERKTYLDRMLELHGRKQVGVIVGGRRAGKTTILRQLIGRLLDAGTQPASVVYLQLDHPQLVSMTALEHLREVRGMFRHPRERELHLFLDEVQDSPDWERQVKAMVDGESVKVVCTGSTSALLGMQGGLLTGRQIALTVHPLSFGEFLQFRGKRPALSESYLLEGLADDYLQTGGYPEQVLSPSDDYLRALVDDILARDILRRIPLRRPAVLHDLLRHLAACVGSRVSFNKIGKILGTDPDTIKDYVGHMASAFLVGLLEKWTPSHAERVYAQKKVYLLDTGIKRFLTGEGDLGAKAESAVFIQLLREGREAGYFVHDQKEVDFVVGGPEAPTAIEVKYEPRFDWQDGRLGGLKAFLRRHPGTRRAIVLTRGAEATLRENKTAVAAVPLWKFLLEGAGAFL